MKKFLVLGILLFTIILNNCIILNPIGLNSGREKGSEAADRIVNAAILTDLINSTLFTRRTSFSILSLIADDVANIESDKYYIKSTVDECVDEITGFTGFLFGSFLANIISCNNLKTDGVLLGEPFPKL
ncbi:MAG: TIGR04452 family lipoprotein [Leptospiraceae bacterium]|nr:TIGR04452 family lipoprotein [Leptospiraceae bacterium]